MRTRERQRRKIPLANAKETLFSTFPCLGPSLSTAIKDALGTSLSQRDQYLLDCLMSKYTGVGAKPLEERQLSAYQGTLRDEQLNAKTNARLCRVYSREQRIRCHNLDLASVLDKARELIAEVLPEWSVGIYETASFTSGAAVGYPKKKGDAYYKFRGRLSCTPDAVREVLALVRLHPLWVSYLEWRFGPDPMDWVEIVDGNEGFTVPKNAETERFACKEPTGNMLLQISHGNAIRKALRSVGVDLNDQSRNATRAWWASLTGEDATLDLKSASNSVVCALVEWLLPRKWVAALYRCRSPYGTVNGSKVCWEMISSMGNGFTFELESLIFWAICSAVKHAKRDKGNRILVYGDDIICPTPIVHEVKAVLMACGFRINHEKSFWKGDFRESCGGHFVAGLDVTPIYIRKPITDTSRVLWFLNSIRRWAGVGGVCDPRLEQLYFRLRRKFVHPRLWGGGRLNSISSLATPHASRERLRFLSDPLEMNGSAAVLRTFMYGRKDDLSLGECLHGERMFDAQVCYEMYGSLPTSRSMSQLVTLNHEVGVEPNPEWPELLPSWIREVEGLAA